MNVIAATAAQGESNMISETTETAAAAPETGQKKTTPGARKPLVARSAAKTTKKAAPPKKATKATPKAKAAPTKAAGEKGVPREGSKTSQVIAMLKRKGGTTLEEIMKAMGWQQHTTRALLSAGGSLTKKHGLVVISEKVGDKRTYSIKA
jgi:hypothetical protein